MPTPGSSPRTGPQRNPIEHDFYVIIFLQQDQFSSSTRARTLISHTFPWTSNCLPWAPCQHRLQVTEILLLQYSSVG